MKSNSAILLTPPGSGAIAVIRLIGPATMPFLGTHFSRPLKPLRAIHGTLLDDAGEEVDDPVIVLSVDQAFADINLHAGRRIVQSVFDMAVRAGFQIIGQPVVPLPDDAVDGNGDINREIAAYLPLATTELAIRTLLNQQTAWRELGEHSSELGPEMVEMILADQSLHWLLHPPLVAIVGAANVGKSTLANRLFAQERSIMADLPGTTRDWVGEIANLDGLAVQLVDTPGIRETDDPIERQAIFQSQNQIDAADLVILVLDVTHPLDPDQSPILSRFSSALRVINKTDAQWVWNPFEFSAIQISARSGVGVEALVNKIRQHFGSHTGDPASPRCWTKRQRDWLTGIAKTGA